MIIKSVKDDVVDSNDDSYDYDDNDDDSIMVECSVLKSMYGRFLQVAILIKILLSYDQVMAILKC